MTLKQVERAAFTGPASQDLNKLQENVIKAVNPITAVPMLSGVFLRNIALTTTLTPVNHGLGREYIGVIATVPNANATVFLDSTWANKSSSVYIRASADCTVGLWVF